MKISKKEWLDFRYSDHLYDLCARHFMSVKIEHEGEEIKDDTSEDFDDLPLSARITVSGFIGNDYTGKRVRSIDSQINIWRKKTSHSTFLVEAEKDALDDVKSAILSAGGKIIL
jgi:hypothetical protein